MKLTNFTMEGSVALRGLGQHWDLHNFVDFAGVELLPEVGGVRLSWTVLEYAEAQREGFSRDNPARKCSLEFSRVRLLRATPVMDGGGASDARTLHEVGLVVPVEKSPAEAIEDGVRLPATNGEGNMLFQFMAGFDIELDAELVTLVAEQVVA